MIFLNTSNLICEAKFEDEQKMSERWALDPELKSGQIEVPERIFEKILSNFTDTEKMMTTNIIRNFVADNIVFGMDVLAHHPEKTPLEMWEFTNVHQVSWTCDWVWDLIKL